MPQKVRHVQHAESLTQRMAGGKDENMQATKGDVAFWATIILVNLSDGWMVFFWVFAMILALILVAKESQ